MKTTNKIILAAAILGMLLSLFLTYTHFQGSPFCVAGQEEACDVINQSIWSELFGIPVALFGFLTFLCFSLGAIFEKKHKYIPHAMTALATGAVGFETYITYMAKTVLDLFCPYCLFIYALLIITFICTIINLKK